MVKTEEFFSTLFKYSIEISSLNNKTLSPVLRKNPQKKVFSPPLFCFLTLPDSTMVLALMLKITFRNKTVLLRIVKPYDTTIHALCFTASGDT